MNPAVVNCATNTFRSDPAKATCVSAAAMPGKGVYHAPPTASSTITFWPGLGPVNWALASLAPQTVEGCWLAGVDASSAPMVKKLSYAMSGNTAMKAGFNPAALQELLYWLLYHDPVEDEKIKGLSASPEHDDR